MSSNLPSRIKHQFKLRNPKKKIISQGEDDLELMSTNLLKLQQQLTEECEDGPSGEIKFDSEGENNQSDYNQTIISQHQQITLNHQSPLESSSSYRNSKQQQSTSQKQNQLIIQQRQLLLNNSRQDIKLKLQRQFEKYLLSNKFSTNYQEKINQLLDSDEEIMSIGNTIGLFEMVYYFKEILTTDVLCEIQQKVFRSILSLVTTSSTHALFNQQIQLLKLIYSELIALSGMSSTSITTYYLHQIIQYQSTFEQSFNVLINMGLMGLQALVKIINEDLQQLSGKVLKEVVKTNLVVSKVIVPQIYSDLLSVASSTKEKNTALCLLSKIGEVAHSQELMQILLQLLKSNYVDKNLLISAIISTGKHQGEKILINLLQQPNINQNIAIFIIKCLSIPSGVRKQMKLKIQICEYNIVDLLQMNNLFYYQGQVNGFILEESHNQDTLYVNSRMLVSLIQKFISQAQNDGQTLVGGGTQCIKSFILPQVITRDEKDDLPNLEIIKVFLSLLQKSKPSLKIKQSLIIALGSISHPQQPIQIIQKLVECLYSSDSSILTATCLSLSKFDFIPSTKVVQRCRELLKYNLWKVRTVACQLIGCLVREPIDTVLETLIKCLKDGSINRELVCQTLLRIHPVCEQLLIEILKSSKDTKIQEIILCSFNEKQILLSDNFLKVLETIFDFSKHPKKQIRYICLGVVNSLRKFSIEQQIETNQFKPKNILPFYYNFLSDSCVQIRDIALQMILQFGNYAQLILIEGMTKGRVNCKIECAKGLGLRGVQNFRALLLGMRDLNQRVRLQCSQSILQNFTIDSILSQQSSSKQSQRISLIYNIKELLQSTLIMIDTVSMRPFLTQLISRLSQGNVNNIHTSCECQLLIDNDNNKYDDNVKDNNDDDQKQMQRQIRQFRQSVRWRQQQLMLSTNDDQYNYQNQLVDGENSDPNTTANNRLEQMGMMPNLKNMKSDANHKRYYFRLNQTLLVE